MAQRYLWHRFICLSNDFCFKIFIMYTRHELPTWAPRLPKGLIKRLYEYDALGIYDEELIDKVGYGLLWRCQSFIQAVEAFHGQAVCPHCNQKIPHNKDKQYMLRCESCHWELSWGDYFSTIQHKQLSGAEPVLQLFSEFVLVFPKLRTPSEKMVQIDRLIHGFHIYFKDNTPTRPVAVNLIKGRLTDVIKFLENLSLSNSSTPGLNASRQAWHENICYLKNWNKKASKS